MQALCTDILRRHYGMAALSVTPMQGGLSALAFRVETATAVYFLKVYDKQRPATATWTAALATYMPIVSWLQHHTDLRDAIDGPVLTLDGGCHCEDERYLYLVFPYIEGSDMGNRLLDAGQVEQIASILARLHSHGTDIPMETDGIRERFQLPFCDGLSSLLATPALAQEDEAMRILRGHGAGLIAAIAKVRDLAQTLMQQNLPFVLCHTDVHGWNLMQGERLHLIDWEGLRMAPAEADLFAFVGDLFWHRCSQAFLETYQRLRPDFVLHSDALAFYQIRRRLEDICAFAESLLYEELSEQERVESMEHLRRECVCLEREQGQ